jgi:hypothetical protein
MAILIGELMPPCRKCKAAPGESCTKTESEARGPIKLSVGELRNNPHKIRMRDAERMSELLDW